jgi:hypothetical protein
MVQVVRDDLEFNVDLRGLSEICFYRVTGTDMKLFCVKLFVINVLSSSLVLYFKIN